MKKLYRIFPALVLSLSLLTGSIGIPVFAEEGGTEGSEGVPERDYTPVTNAEPVKLEANAENGSITGQADDWTYIENDGKEAGPKQSAVTLGATDGSSMKYDVENIYIHVIYNEESGDCSEPVALHVYAKNEGTSDVTLTGMAIAETSGSAAPCRQILHAVKRAGFNPFKVAGIVHGNAGSAFGGDASLNINIDF